MKPDPVPTRLHAFDGLRASMMLLGVVVHTALSYSQIPSSRHWVFKDSQTSIVCDLLLTGSGLFRMPAFFVLAGFFAAATHRRRGPAGLVRDRMRRIGLPLVAGWVIAFPITRAAFAWARTPPSVGPVASTLLAIREGSLLDQPGPMHFWFLENLILYCAVAALTARLVRGMPSLATRLDAAFRGALQSPLGPLAFAAATLPAFWISPGAALETPSSFLPPASSLLGDWGFFAFGWMLGRHPQQVHSLARHPVRLLALALVCWPLTRTAGLLRRSGLDPVRLQFGPELAHTASAAATSLVTWLLVCGVIGLALCYLDRPIRGVRPLVDASFWIYLAHLPLVAWLAPFLADAPLPGEVKLAVVASTTILILLVLHRLATRPGAIRIVPGSWSRDHPGPVHA
jgi:glucan biosynthesis protein C